MITVFWLACLLPLLASLCFINAIYAAYKRDLVAFTVAACATWIILAICVLLAMVYVGYSGYFDSIEEFL